MPLSEYNFNCKRDKTIRVRLHWALSDTIGVSDAKIGTIPIPSDAR